MGKNSAAPNENACCVGIPLFSSGYEEAMKPWSPRWNAGAYKKIYINWQANRELANSNSVILTV
jgi:hypothetical protein